MNHRPHKRPSRISLSLTFSLFVFAIFLITSTIVAGISFIISRTGAVDALGAMAPFGLIASVLISSVLVGTVVSGMLMRIPLKPIRLLIARMKELASGNFDVHLEINRPPEFHELAESFNSMARELGGIEMLRSDFVNNFSHEFKTPIVSIKGFAEMLKYGDLTEEEKNEYLDIVITESARLAELSSNVLYLSKIENQEILSERVPYDLSEQIRHTILLLQSKWENKRIEMNVDLMDVSYTGNEEMLGQVWMNLVDNAIKFTPEGGSIDISLTGSGDAVHVAIRDSGCGIREEAIPHIFDRFYQGDTSHAMAGNGLGLTLAAKIVALHRGAIRCESEEGQGTAFLVDLPCAATSETKPRGVR